MKSSSNFFKVEIFSSGYFWWAYSSHDDYEKIIGDIENRFFALNCHLKKAQGETLRPVTEDLSYIGISLMVLL